LRREKECRGRKINKRNEKEGSKDEGKQRETKKEEIK
jgi:hypothetical protein